MRYLVTIENIETDAPRSPQQMNQLLEQAIIPTLEDCTKLEAEQRLLSGGVAVGSGHTMLIVEVTSTEELNRFVQSLPAWGRLKVAVTPLQSFAQQAGQYRQELDRSNAAGEQTVRDIHKRLGQLRDLAGN